MYQNLRNFLITTMIGGLVVLLPLILLLKISWWLIQFMMEELHPLADILTTSLQINDRFSGIVALLLVMAVCFWVGLIARLRLGNMLWVTLEGLTLKRFPGYSALKEIVNMFSKPNKQSFSKAVLVCPWGDDVWLTGFITDSCENGMLTVFVPCSPNPSTGLVLHLPKENVKELQAAEGLAFKTVLSCGVGAAPIARQIPAKISMTQAP